METATLSEITKALKAVGPVVWYSFAPEGAHRWLISDVRGVGKEHQALLVLEGKKEDEVIMLPSPLSSLINQGHAEYAKPLVRA
jgi:hypothetical protein